MKQVPLSLTFSIQAQEGAFAAWLQARRDSGLIRRESSADLYRDIWGSFSAWCAGQNPPVALASLHRTHLLTFQASRTGVKNAALSARHALRVLRLIDKWSSTGAPPMRNNRQLPRKKPLRSSQSFATPSLLSSPACLSRSTQAKPAN